MSSSETTTDHDTIREWTEARGGRPSIVPTSGGKGRKKSGGVLRLDFGPKEENFEEVSWDDFFAIFDQSELSFLYQDKTADGSESRFNKFVHRSGEDTPATSKPRTRKAAPTKAESGRGATKADLLAKAREKNIEGRSKMTKAELEKAVA